MKFTNYYNFNPHTYSDGILYASSPRLHSVLTIDDLVQKDYIFECEMSNGNYGSHHFGPMIYNKEENYWLFFGYDYDNHSIGVYELKNKNPRNTEKEFISLRHKNLDSSFNINSFHRFKIEVNLQQAFFYLDDILIFEFPFPFFEYYFSFCCYYASFVAKNITIMPIVKEKSFSFWRVSNIKNRRSNQTYRSVGNLLFKAKSGEVSDNPAYGFSESHFDSDSLPGNAFDGLDSTYTLSSSLEDGTNTQEHGNSWWIGYKFLNPVEIEFIDISMRYDMEGVVDNLIDNSLGQDWTSFQIDGSEDGLEWFTVFRVSNPKIFKNDTSVHTYSLPKGEKVYAKFWKIANLQALNGESTWRSFAELRFNTFDKQPFNNLSKLTVSGNGSDGGDRSDKSYLIDGNPNTRWTNMNKDAFVSYEFETPTYIESVDIQPRNDLSYSQELQTADILYSQDGISWIKYGSIYPKIPLNDMSMVKNIPIEVSTQSEFQYQSKILQENKFKFWRCINIRSLGSLDTPVDYRSQSILKFINHEEIELLNKFNSFSSSEYTLELPQGLTTNSFDNLEDTWSTSGAINENSILSAENYSIGCMFNNSVDVYKFGYKPRKGQNINWGQTWTFCNIQYSDNGFDWYDKGYCEFNIPRLDFNYYEVSIQSLNSLERYKFWRVSNVFNKYSGYSLGFSGWELRFNTLTGEVSNDPARGFSNGSWDSYWTPNRAFDGNIGTSSGGFHQKQNNDEQYYIGYKFKEPQYVDSISVIMRRDSRIPDQDWLFAHVEASHDGIIWEHKGYSDLKPDNNTRFFTAKLEDLSPFDKLKYSYINSLQNTNLNTFERIPFSSKYLDPKITNLNIYNPNSNGVVKGQVLELNVPVIREVAIYDRRTRQLIAITWSNEEGFYEFKNLNSSKTYYVHAIDSNKIYNAVTKDMLEPLK